MLPNLTRVTFLELDNREDDWEAPSQITDIPTPVSCHEAVEFVIPGTDSYREKRFSEAPFKHSTDRLLWNRSGGWDWKYFRAILISTSLPIVSLRFSVDLLYYIHDDPEIILDDVEQLWIMSSWFVPNAIYSINHAMFKSIKKPLSSLRDLAISVDDEGYITDLHLF
ncbi:hypothetical protein M422DRAFT_242644 [Sphaerobolus stellatus SS14]|nr:hypothetical protein M422DRAFT_242644 [Sphaerobolus stellatus SS14]